MGNPLPARCCAAAACRQGISHSSTPRWQLCIRDSIRAAGADIVCYGAPVLPGAMFLLGYFDDGTPVMGLPGCVMYAGATIFDLVLPKVAADVPVTRADIAAMGEGGLCLGCKPCRYPVCPFGK